MAMIQVINDFYYKNSVILQNVLSSVYLIIVNPEVIKPCF